MMTSFLIIPSLVSPSNMNFGEELFVSRPGFFFVSHVDATRRDATRRRRIRDARTERFHLSPRLASPRLASPETRARGIIVRGIFCVDSFIHLVLNAELSIDRSIGDARTNERGARAMGSSSSASDASVSSLAIRAVSGDIVSRYGAAEATLGSMTRAWARGGSSDGTTTTKTTKGTVEETKTSARETLKTISNTMFASEVTQGVREVAAAERAAKSKKTKTQTKTKTTTAVATTQVLPSAKKTMKKETKKVVEVKDVAVNAKKTKAMTPTKEEAPARGVEAKVETKAEAKTKTSKARGAAASTAVPGDANPAIEIVKFVLPAICGWLARQRSVSALKKKLEDMTMKKVANATEANKLRREIVDLRDELKRASSAFEDAQESAETMMARKTAGKEIKMKQMALDHAEQLRKERAECFEEVRAAKALEVGARWREEACRKMKNRAIEEAAALEKKVAELEKKLKDMQEDKRKETQEKIKGTVLNAVKSFQSFGRRSSANKEPVVEETPAAAAPKEEETAPVENAPPVVVSPNKSKNKKKSRTKN